MTSIHIKIEAAAKLYQHTRGHIKDKEQFDNNKETRLWQHPSEAIIRTRKIAHYIFTPMAAKR